MNCVWCEEAVGQDDDGHYRCCGHTNNVAPPDGIQAWHWEHAIETAMFNADLAAGK